MNKLKRRSFLGLLAAVPFFGVKKPPVIASFSLDQSEIDQIVEEAVTMAKFYERGIEEGWCTPDEALRELSKQLMIAQRRLQHRKIWKEVRHL